MAREWGMTEQLVGEISLSRRNVLDDPNKGVFIVEATLIHHDDDAAYKIQVDHVSSCKIRILKVSYFSRGVLVFASALRMEVGGSGSRLTSLPVNEITEVSRDFANGTLAIDLQKSQICPCRLCAFQTSYERLLLSSDSPGDIIFQVGDVEIPAHKLILTARYEYFEKMFSSGMKESETNRIQIKDVEPKIFKEVLQFIYTGRLPKSFELESNAYLPIAEQYGMTDLKSACLGAMKKTLSADNALEYISLALKYQLLDLTTAGCDLLKVNLTSENVVGALLLSHNHKLQVLKIACFNKIRILKAAGMMKEAAFKPLLDYPSLTTETILKT